MIIHNCWGLCDVCKCCKWVIYCYPVHALIEQWFCFTLQASDILHFCLQIWYSSFLIGTFFHDRYEELNVHCLETVCSYHEDVPAFLRNRPPFLLQHCLKRLPSCTGICAADVCENDGTYVVRNTQKGTQHVVQFRVRWIIVCHAVIVLTGGATAYPASIFLQSLRSQKVAVARKACRSSTEAFRSLTLIPKSIQPQSQSLHTQTLSRSLSWNHQPQSYILVLSLILLNLSRMSQTSHSPKSQLSSLKSGRFCHWFQRWHTPLTTGIFWPNIYTSFSSNWVTSVASLAVTVGTLHFPWVCMSFNAQILCTNSFVWTWCCPHVKG